MQLRGEQILELAVGRFNEWAQRQAYEASSAGEANTNNVYAEIVRHIARAPVAEASEAPAAGMLRTRLLELEERSQTYSALGLVSLLQVGKIVRELEKSSPDVQDLIGRVVRPYVQGIEARLNALERLQRQLSSFVESLNSFFSNKELSFRLPVGLEIRSKNGDSLTPKMLSSGERQLLLLFCNTAIARDRSSIFLIDEPEISLNVKWQRKLLGSLLEITADSPVQFVIATHSLELLSQFRHSVRRLSNLREVARDA
jgi:ABC-type glutathione transport system ATPase component